MTRHVPSTVDFHRFADPAALADALAESVAGELRRALEARGRASLAVSGGNTPKRFLQALALRAVDWAAVTVTLVDDRWVPESSTRSNAALVRAHLLQGPAAAARFLALHRGAGAPEAALPELEQALEALPLPLDVAILGMGEDGHTASFFPGGDRLQQALDPDGAARVLPMRAPGAGEPRITLTLPVLLAAGGLYLHIEGESKRAVLRGAMVTAPGAEPLPIARVLAHARAPVHTYWSA